MFENINRDALILFPKQALIDWVNYTFPDDPVGLPKLMGHDEGNIYLLPETDHYGEGIELLKKNFKEIFKEELFAWCIDEEFWPKNLTWKLFEEWFHYSIQSMVMDTVDRPVVKESY